LRWWVLLVQSREGVDEFKAKKLEIKPLGHNFARRHHKGRQESIIGHNRVLWMRRMGAGVRSDAEREMGLLVLTWDLHPSACFLTPYYSLLSLCFHPHLLVPRDRLGNSRTCLHSVVVDVEAMQRKDLSP
jgi:hypothetical protein